MWLWRRRWNGYQWVLGGGGGRGGGVTERWEEETRIRSVCGYGGMEESHGRSGWSGVGMGNGG